MSGLLMLFYWVAVPIIAIWLAIWLWRLAKTQLLKGAVLAASTAGLASLFWMLAGGEKWRLDRELEELCAKDGGIRVYETVKLPVEKFDKQGLVRIPRKEDAPPDSEYFYEWNVFYYRKGAPEIWRDHIKIIRRSDRKTLGEDISYARRGGDLPGPWHVSSFRCPKSNDGVEQQIFMRANQGEER